MPAPVASLTINGFTVDAASYSPPDLAAVSVPPGTYELKVTNVANPHVTGVDSSTKQNVFSPLSKQPDGSWAGQVTIAADSPSLRVQLRAPKAPDGTPGGWGRVIVLPLIQKPVTPPPQDGVATIEVAGQTIVAAAYDPPPVTSIALSPGSQSVRVSRLAHPNVRAVQGSAKRGEFFDLTRQADGAWLGNVPVYADSPFLRVQLQADVNPAGTAEKWGRIIVIPRQLTPVDPGGGNNGGGNNGDVYVPPPGARLGITGINIGHQSRERNALDERGLSICAYASMVTSDRAQNGRLSLDFTPEVDAARWQRRFLPAGAHLSVRCMNGWPMLYSQLTDAELDAYANALVDSGFAALVDSFEGPNEPGGGEYNLDADRTTPAGRARINRQWNRVARILRERTGKLVAGPSWVLYQHAVDALDQLPDCNAAAAHPYNWSETELREFSRLSGDRRVLFSEWAIQQKLPTLVEQANANIRRLAVIRPHADYLCWYVWRIPRPKDDAGHNWMAAYRLDGTPHQPLVDFVYNHLRDFRVVSRETAVPGV